MSVAPETGRRAAACEGPKKAGEASLEAWQSSPIGCRMPCVILRASMCASSVIMPHVCPGLWGLPQRR